MSASLDDLVSMAVFARVVREQSFTAAAPHLGLSKSVVSERVSALERRLGTRLLHRTTRKLSLTPDGERLYERFQHVLDAADAAAEVTAAVSGRAEGRLRVAVPVAFGLIHLAGWLPAFARAHPGISIELSVSDRIVDMVAESFDVAIRMAGQLADSSLVARRIGTDPRVIVGSPAYLAARGTPRTIDDLRAHACLRFAGIADEWTFPRPGGPPQRVRVDGPLSADNITVLHTAALEGMGLAVLLGSLVADDLASGRLVSVLGDVEREGVGIYLVTPHRDVVPAKVRVFSDFIAERVRASTAPVDRPRARPAVAAPVARSSRPRRRRR